MIGADQLVAHAVGDYILQSDWMANEKTKKNVAAVAHVATYTLPFLFLTQSLVALLLIAGSHFVIDRWRLARYVCWLKNFLAPRGEVRYFYKMSRAIPPSEVDIARDIKPEKVSDRWWHPWSECQGTGYHRDRPAWMAVWLMIITDNTMHVLCNGLALYYFGG